MTGRSMVGGLVGRNSGPISGSSANVAVTATYIDHPVLAGGLVGYHLNTTISNSHASGNVTGSNDSVGGLVGVSYDEQAADDVEPPRGRD